MNPIGYLVNDHIVDTQTAAEQDLAGQAIVYDNSESSLQVIRHSCAHLMAQAIKAIYPDAKFFVGPVVEDGFYYDFKTSEKVSEEDLPKIEKKMKEIAKKGSEIGKYTISKAEAIEKFQQDELKLEVLKNIPDEQVSIYSQGEFEDLCRGPHLPHTKLLKFFKLTRISGAYLGGDQEREMLTRIYGIAYADKESLQQHLTRLEEAKKRDHRKVGGELELFMFDEEVGAGLPLWLPKGGRLRLKLESIMTKALRRQKYEPVRGPEILKADLWKVSGHYQNYGENMYFATIDEHEYAMKPMNCLGHIKVYNRTTRSYRDLPLKFFEYGVVHRHEQSGELNGLFRVREFTQDDAHIFCTPEQIKPVVYEVIQFVESIMKLFEFSYEMEISTKPEKAIGDDAVWESATQALKEVLDEHGLPYGIDEGGGAFYGPKIDIKITDALGRKWQCGTIQVDMNLPERFEMEYVDDSNERLRPVMIHRAILGSFERFIGILIEHYAGEFPFFLAPLQVIVIPIRPEHQAYAKELGDLMENLGIEYEIDDKNDSLNKRIRTAEKQRVPMICVLGDKEVEERQVAIRDRRTKEQYERSLDEFQSLLKEQMREETV